jgi:hypothetical protein
MHVLITDAAGKVISSNSFQPQDVVASIPVDTRLQAGVYFI